MYLTAEIDQKAFAQIMDENWIGGQFMFVAVKRALERAGWHMRTIAVKRIKQESYLRSWLIREMIDVEETTSYFHRNFGLHSEEAAAVIHVESRKLPFHAYKLVPNRVTARRGMRSSRWPLPGYKIGPGEPVRLAPLSESGAKPFVTISRGKKGMYYREADGLRGAVGVSVQYFAAFDRVSEPVLEAGASYFLKRLSHEVDYAHVGLDSCSWARRR